MKSYFLLDNHYSIQFTCKEQFTKMTNNSFSKTLIEWYLMRDLIIEGVIPSLLLFRLATWVVDRNIDIDDLPAIFEFIDFLEIHGISIFLSWTINQNKNIKNLYSFSSYPPGKEEFYEFLDKNLNFKNLFQGNYPNISEFYDYADNYRPLSCSEYVYDNVNMNNKPSSAASLSVDRI